MVGNHLDAKDQAVGLKLGWDKQALEGLGLLGGKEAWYL